jgi:YidC/Oxa1 family membrane protein insertase
MWPALVLTMVAFVILSGYQYFLRPKPALPAPHNSVQLQTNQLPRQHGPKQSRKSQSAVMDKQGPPSTLAIESATQSETSGRSLEPEIQFGWLTFIAMPLYLVLRFLYEHGIRNWGWAIIILTAIFNFATLWPRILSTKSSMKRMRIQPKANAIKARYAHLKMNDPKRAEMNAEMIALYRAESANMYGGCLPSLLQMPLLFAYSRVLQSAPELRQAHWLWLTDLSAPDPLHILPILIILSMFVTQWITPMQGMDAARRRTLAIIMPLIMGLTLWHYASGLALYWVTGNLFNLVFQLVINRSKIGKDIPL